MAKAIKKKPAHKKKTTAHTAKKPEHTTKRAPVVQAQSDELYKTTSIVLVILLVISIFTNGFRGTSVKSVVKDLDKLESKNLPTNQKTAVSSALKTLEAVVDVKSDDNKPNGDMLVITEYSDFECPFCARAYPTVNQIKEAYAGKVEIVFKHFPLSFHPLAQKAGEASECARDQDMFWDYHDVLFETQELTVTDLKKHAADLGLDVETFNSCLDSGDKASVVQADFTAGQAAGVRGTPTFIIGSEQVVGAQPFENFKVVIDRQLSGEEAPAAPAAPEPTPEPSEYTAKIVNDPVKGNEDAKIAIVEWSDFECPFCKRFYDQTYGDIVKNYIDTGKVKIYFRHFPLSFHAEATPAAEASECANDQGEFWGFHDKLFAEPETYLNAVGYITLAEELGLDMTEFNDCVTSRKHQAAVAADMADGSSAGVRGTPGFVVGVVQEDGSVVGQNIRGAVPYATFQAAIDAELAKV